MRTGIRLRFWLAMLDLAHYHLRASRAVYLWAVGRASNATDWERDETR